MLHPLFLALVAVGTGFANPAVAGSVPADRVDDAEHQWGQWRGPRGTGFAPHADPPLRWSETENVRWKTPIEGFGLSSPVVWGDQVFLTTAIAHGESFEPAPDPDPGAHDNLPVTQRHRFEVIGVDRTNGAVQWRTVVGDTVPHEGGHVSGSQASASPITDGEHVYAFFGSRGLHCLTRSGDLVWSRDFGEMATKHNHGEGASPALHGDTLIVNWDHEGPSVVRALDKNTGETKWQVARDEPTSWATPLIVVHDGRPQVIVNGTRRVRSYDLEDGRVLWECGGLSHNVVASPVFAHGIVAVASSYEKQAAFGIRLAGAEGDLARSENLLWSLRRRTPYVPSLLLVDRSLYMLHHYQGVLSQVHLETGEDVHRPTRLPGIRHVYASPVAAAGRLYITDQNGTTLVLQHGETPTPLATNTLEEPIDASLALVGQQIFARGHRHLYCIDGP